MPNLDKFHLHSVHTLQHHHHNLKLLHQKQFSYYNTSVFQTVKWSTNAYKIFCVPIKISTNNSNIKIILV